MKGTVMAKHLVICPYCKIKFDTNTEPFVKPSATRYAHKTCYEKHQAEMTDEEREEEAFYKYARQLFGEDFNYLVTKKLAERYIKENGYLFLYFVKIYVHLCTPSVCVFFLLISLG